MASRGDAKRQIQFHEATTGGNLLLSRYLNTQEKGMLTTIEHKSLSSVSNVVGVMSQLHSKLRHVITSCHAAAGFKL